MTRRVRRRLEAVAALVAFPLAVALTVLAISVPVRGQPSPTAAAAPSVLVQGEDPLDAYAVAERLAGSGYDVVAVGTTDKSVSAHALVVYYERQHQATAVRLRDLLGGGTIRREQVLNPGSDLTVLLGKDPQGT